MKSSTIIFILVLLTIVVFVLYYFYYLKTDDSNNKKPIPHNLLYEQDKTIIGLLKDVSTKYGRYPALKYKIDSKPDSKWNTVSYSEYNRKITEFAENSLYRVGALPRTAILSFNRPEWFYSHMGTIMAGGVSVGMYPTASSDNCTYVINHACVDILVVEDIKQLLKFVDSKIPTVKLILIIDEDKDDVEKMNVYQKIKNNNPNLMIDNYNFFVTQTIGSENLGASIEFGDISPDDVATIIYTSGTTGDPKGVVITHSNIIESLKASLHSIMTRSNIILYMQESFVSYLPLNHIASQMLDIYIPLASVGIVHFANRDALKGTLKDTLKEVRPTIFIGVPRVWEKIYEKIKEKREDPNSLTGKLFINNLIVQEMGLDRVKMCVTTAAPISDHIKEFFRELGIELCDVYGMSETTGPISMGVPGCSKGLGVPVVDVKIEKTTGEILVRGKSIFREYYKNKKLTDEAFLPKNWFKTGDIGYIDRSGILYLTGRIKDIIVTSGGENISPNPIENMLMAEINKESHIVDYVVVIGDQRRFLSVLFIPSKHISKKGCDDKIKKSIDKVNKKAPNNASTVKKYLILEGETFDVDDCLTPTMKIKRKRINEKYKKQIDKLYLMDDK